MQSCWSRQHPLLPQPALLQPGQQQHSRQLLRQCLHR